MTLKQRLGRWLFSHLPITRFLFDQLRAEANAGYQRAVNTVSPQRRRRLSKIRNQRELLVNVACGPQHLPGFLNIDLMPCHPDILGWDCRWSLPLANESARGIRAEQFVEHLEPQEEVPAFLKECLRALRPGGILRLIVPDAERYLRAYCRDDRQGFDDLGVPDPFPEDLPTKMDVINHVFHQWSEHRWGYDYETLAHRLATAGFRTIERSFFHRSGVPELANDRDEHAPYSLYLEAMK